MRAGYTGGWSSWLEEAVTLTLRAGPNQIALQASSGDGGPNVDLIAFSSSTLSVGACTDCSGEAGGTAYFDDCGECVGGNTGEEACTLDCNGDLNGTAYVDNCDICVEGSTGLLPCVSSVEAEEACFVAGILLESVNAGYSGEGYVNTDNEVGASVVWQMESATADSTTLTLVFANGGSGNRDGILYVNGDSLGLVALPSTGGWTTWEEVTTDVYLEAGNNTIELVAISSGGLANLDVLHFTTAVAVGSCDVTSAEDLLRQKALRLYPNPTDGVLHFSLRTPWQLLSIEGKRLMTGTGTEADLSNLAGGMYFVKTPFRVYKVVKR